MSTEDDRNLALLAHIPDVAAGTVFSTLERIARDKVISVSLPRPKSTDPFFFFLLPGATVGERVREKEKKRKENVRKDSRRERFAWEKT